MTPSRSLLLLPLAMVFALQGCKLNVVDRPEQVEAGHTFVLRPDFTGEPTGTNSLSPCLSLPVGWSIESAQYTEDGEAAAPTPYPNLATHYESDRPRSGFAWHCFTVPDVAQNASATIQVPSGEEGAFRLASLTQAANGETEYAEFDIFVGTAPSRYGHWTLAKGRLPESYPHVVASFFTNDRHFVITATALDDDNVTVVQSTFFSDDGFNWSEWPLGLPGVYDLVSAGDRFVAVTSEGVHVSDDFETWSTVYESEHLERVARGPNGLLVVVGAGELIISNDDGGTWTASGDFDDINLRRIACTDTVCVAVELPDQAFLSTDGATWAPVVIPDASDVQALHDRFVLRNDSEDTLQFSLDGETWEAPTAPFGPGEFDFQSRTLSFHDGRFFYGGPGGRMSWTDDGVTWNERRAGTGGEIWAVQGRPELAVLVTRDSGILLNESGALAITTARHLAAAQNESFSRRFHTVGNHKPHSVTLVGGTLPKGLSLESGELTGTPEESGDFTYVLRVTDANEGSVDDTFHLHVEAAAPELLGGALPAAGAGLPYSATITAVNGASPLTWSHDGTLPEGLSFAQDGDTYVLSGTTEDLGSHTFDVAVTDRLGRATDATYTLLVEDRPSITTDAQLPFGVVGRSYQEAITAEGGTPPYTWSYDGALPPGLALTAAPQEGVGAGEGEDEGENENVIDAFYLAGIPTAAGSWTFENVTVTDANGVSTSADFTFEVVDAPSFATKAQLPKGVVGKPYQTFIIADGGTHPLVWSYDGALPDGLTLTQNSSWYVLSGTPTTPGSYTLADVTVTDANGGWARRTFTLEVVDAPTITSDELPAGEVGAQYAAIITAEGGEDPYTWTLPKNVPAGLTVSVVDGNVNVTGIPEEAGSFELTFTVSDANDAETVRTYTLVIAPEEEDEEPEPTDPGDDEPTDPQPGNDSGCGCSGTSPAGLALLAALAFTLRRRPILLG